MEAARLPHRLRRGVHVQPRPVHRQHRLPTIGRHFGDASLESLSWILSGYAIVFAALLVPVGRWADAFGRKRAFLLSLGIFVAASAGCALAPSVGVLIGARVLQATGGALMLPTSLGLMRPEFGPHERHVAIGVWAVAGGIAAAGGPPLGGLLVQADWRWVFLVDVPVGLLGVLLGAHAGRAPRVGRGAPRRPRRGRPDRGDRLARPRHRQGPGMGLGLTRDRRPARRDGRVPAGHLVALGTPRRTDCRALDAEGAQLRPGGGSLGAVLRPLRRDAASGSCSSRPCGTRRCSQPG
jgi:MFS family permease